MLQTKFDLERHLKEDHHVTPLSTYLKEIVYGGNDGIVTTFAVVAGFAGAQNNDMRLPVLAVLLFGFANLFADAVSMALGNFLSTRSEQDVYKKFQTEEIEEVKNDHKGEIEQTLTILMNKGFTQEDAQALVKLYSKNKTYWLEFMMEKELALPNPANDHAGLMALSTFVAFIIFGLIPLLPYVLFRDNQSVFFYSIAATFGALTLLGFFRYKVTKQNLLRSVGETLFLGGTAALVAYFVGTQFRI